mmetsp:Transcript_7963/g.10953  ORF Transcript_7963/g.10953 Transcript_7963/m.10953 type:complete len:624 (+) Transcript_7963:38-1909(+)
MANPAVEVAPPPDIKIIIDRTASFVARIGPDFEKRIFEKEKGEPKFNFLKPTDIFHTYYRNRIQAYKEELANEQGVSAPQTDVSVATQPIQAVQTGAAVQEPPKYGPTGLVQRILNITRKLKAENKPPEKPIPDLFILDVPHDISAQDLDIMKLTAQYVAKNGHQFQVGLMNREAKNSQFDFLKQGDPFHNFFLSLVEAYTRCLVPPKGLADKLTRDFSDKQVVLDRLILRYEWERQEREKKELEQKIADEKTPAVIDWHDFVVVETIDFMDEEEQLAAMAGLTPLQPMLQTPTVAPAPPKVEEDIEMETDDMETDEPVKPQTEIKIRKDYIRGSNLNKTRLQVCPRCGQEVPVDDMAEHMRIELLDPKYAQQRQVLLDRTRGVSLASGSEIAHTLGAFAKKRSDIFGSEDAEVTKTSVREDKKTDEKFIWDGHAASAPRANTATSSSKSLEEQIAAIHANKGLTTPSDKPAPPPPRSVPPPPGIVTPTTAPPPPRPVIPPPPGIVTPEPQAKRLKTEDTIQLSEEAFLSRYSGPYEIKIQTPEDNSKPEWKLNGQVLTIKVNARDSIGAFKEQLKEQTGLPANKQKLNYGSNLLADNKSFAFYNISPGVILDLKVKSRGGKK